MFPLLSEWKGFVTFRISFTASPSQRTESSRQQTGRENEGRAGIGLGHSWGPGIWLSIVPRWGRHGHVLCHWIYIEWSYACTLDGLKTMPKYTIENWLNQARLSQLDWELSHRVCTVNIVRIYFIRKETPRKMITILHNLWTI